MSETKSLELRVSVDVGYRRHSVAIGLPNGEVLEEFEITHRPEGFKEFFSRIEKHQKEKGCGVVAVAMEGYNGYARPLDSLVRQRGYRLYNINNLKLARFKEIFPGAAKKDQIDARKGLELFQGYKKGTRTFFVPPVSRPAGLSSPKLGGFADGVRAWCGIAKINVLVLRVRDPEKERDRDSWTPDFNRLFPPYPTCRECPRF